MAIVAGVVLMLVGGTLNGLNDEMTTVFDDEISAVIDDRTDEKSFFREDGDGSGNVEMRERIGQESNGRSVIEDSLTEFIKDLHFKIEGFKLRTMNTIIEFSEFKGFETNNI